MHDGRSVVAPHGDAGGQVDLVAQLRQDRPRLLHRIEPVEPGQPQLQRERPQVVAATDRILRHRPQPHEADQVAVRLGRVHAGGGGEVAQHHRARRRREGLEQLEAHFDGLDAGAQLGVVFFVFSNA
ncbi:hypothetical protein D9M69_477000 [compost metagenome]